LEYYAIKVNQFNDYAKDSLDEWIYFFKNEEIKSEFKARGLKEASEKLQIMRLSPEEQGKYRRYLEELHYEASMAQSKLLDMSVLDGIREGIEQGLKEGERLAAIQIARIARNLLESGLSSEAVQSATGLCKEEIEKLRLGTD
jgi:predicted transposase/invertase (TIGR01784 family)